MNEIIMQHIYDAAAFYVICNHLSIKRKSIYTEKRIYLCKQVSIFRLLNKADIFPPKAEKKVLKLEHMVDMATTFLDRKKTESTVSHLYFNMASCFWLLQIIRATK